MENIETYRNEEKGRCVYAAPIARALIRKGYAVTDIKPNRADYDKTVFVFKETEAFNKDFEDALNEYSARKEQRRLNKIARETFVADEASGEAMTAASADD